MDLRKFDLKQKPTKYDQLTIDASNLTTFNQSHQGKTDQSDQ